MRDAVDMEHRLTADMGYRFTGDKWFNAVDLDLNRVPGGKAQAKQMRQMVARMIEAQKKAASKPAKARDPESPEK